MNGKGRSNRRSGGDKRVDTGMGLEQESLSWRRVWDQSSWREGLVVEDRVNKILRVRSLRDRCTSGGTEKMAWGEYRKEGRNSSSLIVYIIKKVLWELMV